MFLIVFDMIALMGCTKKHPGDGTRLALGRSVARCGKGSKLGLAAGARREAD